MKKARHIPPRWASRFLEWYCRPSLYEDLQGDLLEYFERNVENRGAAYARLVYVVDVFKFFRPYTVKKWANVESSVSRALMSNYFKVAVRNMARNRMFTAVNITGLAIGMSAGILMITFLTALWFQDNFHEKGDRIYRVISHYQGDFKGKKTSMKVAGVSVAAAKMLGEELAGVEEVVIMRQGVAFDLKSSGVVLPMKGCFASPSFFDVFSFGLEKGHAPTALIEPRSIVLTNTAARKLFGDTEPLGQLVFLPNSPDGYLVKGVMPVPPANSHLQFEFLIPFSAWEQMEQKKGNLHLMDWNNVWTNQAYILLSENSRIEDVENAMLRIAERENERFEQAAVFLEAQSLRDVSFGQGFFNDRTTVIEKRYVFILIALTAVVLASACFNYANLSLARSLRRSKEVGVRKIAGASGRQISAQIITEAVVLAFMAFVLAFPLFLIIRRELLALPFGVSGRLDLPFTAAYFVLFALLTLAVGVLAGVVPAVFLSRFKSGVLPKDTFGNRPGRWWHSRGVLVVVQFAISIAFLTATTIIYSQHKYALQFDPGFSTKSILNIDLQGNEPDWLLAEFAQWPEVTSVSRAAIVLGTDRKWGDNAYFKDPLNAVNFYYNSVDQGYVEQHGFLFLAGGNFPLELQKDAPEKYIIINETMWRALQIETPAAAIGEAITIDSRQELQIVGVVKDFHHGTVKDDIRPFAFRQVPSDFNYVNVEINTADLPATLREIEQKWAKLDPIHSFRASFFDDHMRHAYMEYETMFKITGFLSFLAISISTLGLLGMVVFTTESRLKEIGVRKVLGASTANLIYLLSHRFLIMFLIAASVAVPGSYLVLEQFVLSEFSYRISPGPLELLCGVAFILFLGGCVVFGLTTMAARTNPAHILRNE